MQGFYWNISVMPRFLKKIYFFLINFYYWLRIKLKTIGSNFAFQSGFKMTHKNYLINIIFYCMFSGCDNHCFGVLWSDRCNFRHDRLSEHERSVVQYSKLFDLHRNVLGHGGPPLCFFTRAFHRPQQPKSLLLRIVYAYVGRVGRSTGHPGALWRSGQFPKPSNQRPVLIPNDSHRRREDQTYFGQRLRVWHQLHDGNKHHRGTGYFLLS